MGAGKSMAALPVSARGSSPCHCAHRFMSVACRLAASRAQWQGVSVRCKRCGANGGVDAKLELQASAQVNDVSRWQC